MFFFGGCVGVGLGILVRLPWFGSGGSLMVVFPNSLARRRLDQTGIACGMRWNITSLAGNAEFRIA